MDLDYLEGAVGLYIGAVRAVRTLIYRGLQAEIL